MQNKTNKMAGSNKGSIYIKKHRLILMTECMNMNKKNFKMVILTCYNIIYKKKKKKLFKF